MENDNNLIKDIDDAVMTSSNKLNLTVDEKSLNDIED